MGRYSGIIDAFKKVFGGESVGEKLSKREVFHDNATHLKMFGKDIDILPTSKGANLNIPHKDGGFVSIGMSNQEYERFSKLDESQQKEFIKNFLKENHPNVLKELSDSYLVGMYHGGPNKKFHVGLNASEFERMESLKTERQKELDGLTRISDAGIQLAQAENKVEFEVKNILNQAEKNEVSLNEKIRVDLPCASNANNFNIYESVSIDNDGRIRVGGIYSQTIYDSSGDGFGGEQSINTKFSDLKPEVQQQILNDVKKNLAKAPEKIIPTSVTVGEYKNGKISYRDVVAVAATVKDGKVLFYESEKDAKKARNPHFFDALSLNDKKQLLGVLVDSKVSDDIRISAREQRMGWQGNFKQYPDEPLNPRIRDVRIFVDRDEIALRMTVDGKEKWLNTHNKSTVDAYNAGAIPDNVLANRALNFHDGLYANLASRFEMRMGELAYSQSQEQVNQQKR